MIEQWAATTRDHFAPYLTHFANTVHVRSINRLIDHRTAACDDFGTRRFQINGADRLPQLQNRLALHQLTRLIEVIQNGHIGIDAE